MAKVVPATPTLQKKDARTTGVLNSPSSPCNRDENDRNNFCTDAHSYHFIRPATRHADLRAGEHREWNNQRAHHRKYLLSKFAVWQQGWIAEGHVVQVCVVR